MKEDIDLKEQRQRALRQEAITLMRMRIDKLSKYHNICNYFFGFGAKKYWLAIGYLTELVGTLREIEIRPFSGAFIFVEFLKREAQCLINNGYIDLKVGRRVECKAKIIVADSLLDICEHLSPTSRSLYLFKKKELKL